MIHYDINKLDVINVVETLQMLKINPNGVLLNKKLNQQYTYFWSYCKSWTSFGTKPALKDEVRFDEK